MRRGLFLAVLPLLFAAGPSAAQDWAKKMFKTNHHNFGVVARGAKAEFPFELTNCFVEDVHIASVRSTCGCTTAKVPKPTLATWEKGSVVAVYNTTSFLGQRTSTITVTFDKPFFAEVQLTSEGFVRGDVVFEPGEVDFGELDLGADAQRTVRVSYAGRSDWAIVDVRSANIHLEVELSEKQRVAGRVEYDMTVRLKPGAAAGYIHDQLTLVTNDEQQQTIPVAIAGRLLAPLDVSPESLLLGPLKPGETVTKSLVVRGRKPFKVVDVKCEDDGFEFQIPDEAKTLHLIPVKYTASNKTGKIVDRITIHTDLGPEATANCVAIVTIVQDASSR